MPSDDSPGPVSLAAELRQMLLAVARQAVGHGVDYRRPPEVDAEAFPPPLRARRATFVTLKCLGHLRGCIGTLEARRPLVVDVALNAAAAALRDPRFPPLGRGELAHLAIHLSVLSPPQPITAGSDHDLLAQLRVGVDGLILADPPHRSTFLPAVWDTLPDPRQFLAHLKQKAGLPPDYWSDTLRFARYTVESIP